MRLWGSKETEEAIARIEARLAEIEQRVAALEAMVMEAANSQPAKSEAWRHSCL